MASTTLPGVLLTGIHASRPAANAVATGTLYSCTTHSLVYQTDGSTWTTWATLGSGSGTLTTVEEADGSPTDSAVTKIVFPNGTLGIASHVATYTPASSGGLSHSYVGYNTAGASNENFANTTTLYAKSVTLASAGLLTSISCYVKQAADLVPIFSAGIYTDNAGTPAIPMAGMSAASFVMETGAGSGFSARWVHVPMGVYLAAGTYWLCFGNQGGTSAQIHYDTSGSDVTIPQGGTNWFPDVPREGSVSTTTKKYSIRGSLLS